MPSVDEYRSSPQKISKYERNEFKRPVVIQGALKRGAKHTMESIEEEDENQGHNERVKTAARNDFEDSTSNINPNQTYVSVTPTPPKSEARKTSQNNISTSQAHSQIYNGIKSQKANNNSNH